MKKCDCGNNIDPRDRGEDATQCEWCKNPDPPIYVIREYGKRVELTYLGMNGTAVELRHDDQLTVFAPYLNLAEQIRDDWLAQKADN